MDLTLPLLTTLVHGQYLVLVSLNLVSSSDNFCVSGITARFYAN